MVFVSLMEKGALETLLVALLWDSVPLCLSRLQQSDTCHHKCACHMSNWDLKTWVGQGVVGSESGHQRVQKTEQDREKVAWNSTSLGHCDQSPSLATGNSWDLSSAKSGT